MGRQQQPQSLIPWARSLNQFPRFGLFPDLWEEFDQLADFEDQRGLTISEDKENVYLEAAMPGLKPSDIEVTLDKGIVWIRGEKKEEVEDKDKKYYRKASTSFSYRLALPGQIDEAKEPKAVYQEGIMKITFVKAKQNQAKKIAVKGS